LPALLLCGVDFVRASVNVALMNGNTTTTEPVRFSASLSGGSMAGWRWVNDDAPPLLFCHATGFCASVYKQMLQHLSGVYDVFALDMRGHGKTDLPADPKRLRSWDIYARDIAAFLDSQKREGWTLAGHSMGGVVVTVAAKNRPDIAALRLIEPVVMPAYLTFAARTPFWRLASARIPIVRGAAKRRASWPDRNQVLKSYQRKRIFSGWAEGVLGDYLEDGLVVADGACGVSLACDPRWEAATFAAHANDFWGAIRSSGVPVRVLAADEASSTIPGRARMRCDSLGVRVRELAGLTHLAPMEDPARCAEFLANAAYGV
jgi:pimeloyl-ACP methyl ester carboxylesterase